MQFSWDPKKSKSNKRKHGVSFLEAQSCFFDPMHIFTKDEAHSGEEDRFILLGMSTENRLLVVVHAEQYEEEIRIISARKCTKSERKNYQEV